MHILALRFSALGDVALTLPALQSVLQQNPELEITLLSRKAFAPIFANIPRLHFFGANVKGEHKGAAGLLKLAKALHRQQKFDAVIDLHGLLRSRVISAYFAAKGIKTLRFDKGRQEKKDLVAGGALRKLPHATARYLAPFGALGLKNTLLPGPWRPAQVDTQIEAFLHEHHLTTQHILVGIAPFAQHVSKEWPLQNVERVIEALAENTNCRVLLFGGGPVETQKLAEIAARHPNCINAAGKLGLGSELNLMARLRAMLSMDSANMHLATLCGTPVVSIWGPTHHFLGFGPLGNEELIVEMPVGKLPCRPCSVFGKLENEAQRQCAEKAMQGISPQMVLKKLLPLLK